MTITFNAFSFLQAKLATRQIGCLNAKMKVAEGTTVEELIEGCGLSEREVEGVFLNGRIVSRDQELHNGDRVALVPPGTPGPYRVLLRMAKLPRQ